MLQKSASAWRCLKVKMVLVPLLTAFGAAAILFVVVTYGNPQWNRWIYVWQAYYWPKRVAFCGEMPPQRKDLRCPDGYDGIWRVWKKNGRLFLEFDFNEGVLKRRTWYGFEARKRGETFWRGNAPHGPHMEWSPSGTIESLRYYLNGTKVTRSEYRAAYAQDPTLPKPPDEDIGKPQPNPDVGNQGRKSGGNQGTRYRLSEEED